MGHAKELNLGLPREWTLLLVNYTASTSREFPRPND